VPSLQKTSRRYKSWQDSERLPSSRKQSGVERLCGLQSFVKLESALYQEVVRGTIEELGVGKARKVETTAGKEGPVLLKRRQLKRCRVLARRGRSKL